MLLSDFYRILWHYGGWCLDLGTFREVLGYGPALHFVKLVHYKQFCALLKNLIINALAVKDMYSDDMTEKQYWQRMVKRQSLTQFTNGQNIKRTYQPKEKQLDISVGIRKESDS